MKVTHILKLIGAALLFLVVNVGVSFFVHCVLFLPDQPRPSGGILSGIRQGGFSLQQYFCRHAAHVFNVLAVKSEMDPCVCPKICGRNLDYLCHHRSFSSFRGNDQPIGGTGMHFSDNKIACGIAGSKGWISSGSTEGLTR